MQTTLIHETDISLAQTLENIHIEANEGGPTIGELTNAVGDKGCLMQSTIFATASSHVLSRRWMFTFL